MRVADFSLGKAVLEISTDLGKFNVEGAEKKLQGFGLTAKQSLAVFAGAATAATAAVGAIAAGIVELGIRGSGIADVSDSFAGLSRASGQTADVMLGALRAGTAGTIADFDLMKAANKALGAGFTASADDMQTLAGGAKLLADRVGGDTLTSFEELTSALASGRVKGLAQLGLFVDTKAAAEQYAKSVGKTTGELTAAETQTAASNAVLAQLREQLQAAGAGGVDFADRIDQAKTMLANFSNALAEAVARSPVIAAGLDAIGASALGAFGGNQQSAVKALMGFVNEFAIVLVRAGEYAVMAAGVIARAWSGLQLVFSATASIFSLIELGLYRTVQAAADLASKLPGVGSTFQAVGNEARVMVGILTATQKGFHEQAEAALEGVKGHSQFQTVLDTVGNTLAAAREKMIAARGAQVGLAAATDATSVSMRTAIAVTDELTKAEIKAAAEAAKVATEYRAYLNFLGEREIEDHQRVMDAKAAAETALRNYQNDLGVRLMEQDALVNQTVIDRAKAAGFETRAALQETADTAKRLYGEMLESGKFTSEQLQEAWDRYDQARKLALVDQQSQWEKHGQTLLDGTVQVFSQLGKRFKAAAIAGAIIATYSAIAKALASAPWPFNLVLAAGAAAAGFANVAKIKSSQEGFKIGTPNLDFMPFRREGEPVTLHGDEAVIPRGRGHLLAGEIASALGGGLRGADVTQTVIVKIGDRVIANAAARGLPRVLAVNGLN
jgi:hypothetical protein